MTILLPVKDSYRHLRRWVSNFDKCNQETKESFESPRLVSVTSMSERRATVCGEFHGETLLEEPHY